MGLPESLGGLGEGTGVLFIDTESKFSPQVLDHPDPLALLDSFLFSEVDGDCKAPGTNLV